MSRTPILRPLDQDTQVKALPDLHQSLGLTIPMMRNKAATTFSKLPCGARCSILRAVEEIFH